MVHITKHQKSMNYKSCKPDQLTLNPFIAHLSLSLNCNQNIHGVIFNLKFWLSHWWYMAHTLLNKQNNAKPKQWHLQWDWCFMQHYIKHCKCQNSGAQLFLLQSTWVKYLLSQFFAWSYVFVLQQSINFGVYVIDVKSVLVQDRLNFTQLVVHKPFWCLTEVLLLEIFLLFVMLCLKDHNWLLFLQNSNRRSI